MPPLDPDVPFKTVLRSFAILTHRMRIVHHLLHREQTACRFLGKELSLPSEFAVSKQYN